MANMSLGIHSGDVRSGGIVGDPGTFIREYKHESAPQALKGSHRTLNNMGFKAHPALLQTLKRYFLGLTFFL